MNKLTIYCLSLYNDSYKKIKSLGYVPVGLGKENFHSKWLRDNTGNNISFKNPYYGEYTFHYWFWKNQLKKMKDNQWIGFCAYRRFWSNNENLFHIKKKSDFLRYFKRDWKKYDVILGNDIFMNGWTIAKIIKHGLRSFILKPKFFLKKNRNIKLHFDSFHGYGNLDKAISLLNKNDRDDFKLFTENQNFFNRGNMFICGSKKLLNNYYKTIFKWLEKCETVFGFREENYGKKRIYGFLIERFSSYWFNKYAKTKKWPIIFFDINKTNKI